MKRKQSCNIAVVILEVTGSGVTTGSADPAMRGAHGPMGAQNYGIYFTENLTQQFLCTALSKFRPIVIWLQCRA